VLAINPQTVARIRAYLEVGGARSRHRLPYVPAAKAQRQAASRALAHGPCAIDRVVRKYAVGLGLDRGYSAQSMRATFIITALENDAPARGREGCRVS
jgi:hypothetical protein